MTYKNPNSEYIVQKMKYRQLFDMIMRIEDENELEICIREIKENKRVVEYSEEALKIFYEAWKNQKNAKRQFAFYNQRIIQQKVAEEKENKISSEIKNISTVYTYQMCHTLALSILMIIKIHSTKAPEYVFYDYKQKLQKIILTIIEQKNVESAHKLYSQLLSIQLKVILLISKINN